MICTLYFCAKSELTLPVKFWFILLQKWTLEWLENIVSLELIFRAGSRDIESRQIRSTYSSSLSIDGIIYSMSKSFMRKLFSCFICLSMIQTHHQLHKTDCSDASILQVCRYLWMAVFGPRWLLLWRDMSVLVTPVRGEKW